MSDYGGEPCAIGRTRLVPSGCEADAIGEIEAKRALDEVERGDPLHTFDEVFSTQEPPDA